MANRTVALKRLFNEPTTDNRFANLYAAEAWIKAHGYSIGQMCHPKPMAVMIGDYDWIAKWKNLTKAEIEAIDGYLIGVGADGYELNLYELTPQITAA